MIIIPYVIKYCSLHHMFHFFAELTLFTLPQERVLKKLVEGIDTERCHAVGDKKKMITKEIHLKGNTHQGYFFHNKNNNVSRCLARRTKGNQARAGEENLRANSSQTPTQR